MGAAALNSGSFFAENPQRSFLSDVWGVPIALDAESQERLWGAVIDWEASPEEGFVLRHPDAVLVEFC